MCAVIIVGEFSTVWLLLREGVALRTKYTIAKSLTLFDVLVPRESYTKSLDFYLATK